MIPVNEPLLGKEELNKVVDCLKTNWISSQGKYLKEFEEKFARYCGVRYGISTTSGTTALHLALAALGVGPGDEVLIPTFTMAATAFAVCYCGATPVFIDSDSETFNIDLDRISSYLRTQKKRGKVKAILPVHMYGHPVDMDPLLEMADHYSISVIEDAAEAHGAEYKGKKCGSFGALGCFSFYANKIITTGEGGMVVTNDPRLAERARRLKDLAHSPEKRFLHTALGFNYRMTNLQAALGVAQLKKINSHIKKKRWMAKEYEKELKHIPGLRLPIEKPWAKNVYWMYGILVEKTFGLSRDQLMVQLKNQGIDTRTFFVPMHLQTVFKEKTIKSKRFARYPVAERLSEQGFYLPSGLTISRDQIRYIGDQIKRLAS